MELSNFLSKKSKSLWAKYLVFFAIICNQTIIKKLLGKISRYSQETPLFETLFDKVKASNFIKKRLRHRCFPVNLAQFLENLSWLLLKIAL